jgi:hypothetical protein
MKDLVFVLVTIGFFTIAAAYVRACTRIVGPDDPEATAGEESEAEEVTA